jgi:RNA polymerase sigma-70 factor (ECF subfamily)
MHNTPVTLLLKLRAGADPQAWSRFVELFAPLVFHWARRFGLQEADAEETVQDVFVILLGRLPRFDYDPSRSFRAWLSTVTRHEAFRRLGDRTGAALPADSADAVAASASCDAEDREYAAWLMQRAARLIERDFEPVTWQAFHRYVLDDRPAAEVAVELGITRNAVYLSSNRVLARLRQDLAGLLD